jgi:hypothetical protein
MLLVTFAASEAVVPVLRRCWVTQVPGASTVYHGKPRPFLDWNPSEKPRVQIARARHTHPVTAR